MTVVCFSGACRWIEYVVPGLLTFGDCNENSALTHKYCEGIIDHLDPLVLGDCIEVSPFCTETVIVEEETRAERDTEGNELPFIQDTYKNDNRAGRIANMKWLEENGFEDIFYEQMKFRQERGIVSKNTQGQRQEPFVELTCRYMLGCSHIDYDGSLGP